MTLPAIALRTNRTRAFDERSSTRDYLANRMSRCPNNFLEEHDRFRRRTFTHCIICIRRRVRRARGRLKVITAGVGSVSASTSGANKQWTSARVRHTFCCAQTVRGFEMKKYRFKPRAIQAGNRIRVSGRPERNRCAVEEPSAMETSMVMTRR